MVPVVLWWLLGCAAPPEPGLTVFAAASLTDVLPGVAEAWTAESGVAVGFGFDGSSKLAKQIESGQPVDVFWSADVGWVAHLADQGLLIEGSQRELLGNGLVVIVPASAEAAPASAGELAGPGVLRIAMAGENVPAGRYGRAALRAQGLWPALEGRVVSGDDVRTALTWVARGEADAGIVYATDARSAPDVRIAFALPPDSHPPIVYPAAVSARSAHPEQAADFLAFCAGPEARRLFEAAGFVVVAR